MNHRYFRDVPGSLYQVDPCLIEEQNGEPCDRVCNACEQEVTAEHPVAYEVVDGLPLSVGTAFHEGCLKENMKEERHPNGV